MQDPDVFSPPPPSHKPAPPPLSAPVPGNTQRTSTLAIVSLVASILGWVALPFVGSVTGIITGHLARGEIRRTPGLQGDGMAVAGLALGYAAIVLSLLALAAMLGLVLLGSL